MKYTQTVITLFMNLADRKMTSVAPDKQRSGSCNSNKISFTELEVTNWI